LTCLTDIYAGEWQHNKKEGLGLYRFADGKFVEGIWLDNKYTVSETPSIVDLQEKEKGGWFIFSQT
jgi:hypothetical protein